jgi:hypothetical protein
MKTESIRWRLLDRDTLPEALYGESSVEDTTTSTLVSNDLETGRIALGFVGNQRQSVYNPPSIVVVADRSAAEIFSWLKTYAEETSPLSQFGRVVTTKDWEFFSGLMNVRQINTCREDYWASVILGEALAQGEGEGEPSTMPLSRALGCFSTAVARTASIYGHQNAMRECTERLQKLAADPRFVRRSVAIEDLMPVWGMTNSKLAVTVTSIEAVDLVVNFAWKNHFNNLVGVVSPSLLREHSGLFSDSIEERVIAFNLLSNVLVQFAVTSPRGNFCGVLLAAGAFLVGRSTSHEFLLRKFGRQIPTAFVWFGLVAALAGPRAWDANWSRATKGIERQVRAKFDWTESVGADLYWAEFIWLANNFEGNAVFTILPKMLPKVLSIEVVPGATCQLRLAVGGAIETEVRATDPTSREKDLQSALAQLVSLAARMKPLLDSSSAGIQKTLDLDESPNYQKSSRAKQTKRTKG